MNDDEASEAVQRVHVDLRRRLADRALILEVFDAIDQAVLVHDGDARLLAVNRAALAWIGTPVEEVLGRTVVELGWRARAEDGSDVPWFRLPPAAAARTMAPVVETLLLQISPEAEPAWSELASYPLAPADGSSPLVVTTVNDVSGHLAHLQQLELQARILDSFGQPAIGLDADYRIRYWNRAAERMFGWRAEEVVGHEPRGFTVPADDPTVHAVFAAMDAGEPWTGDVRCFRADGSTFEALVNTAPIVDRFGHRAGIVVTVSDITERKDAEQLRSRLSAIVETSGDAIIGVSLDGMIQSWNRAATELYGWTPEEALGSPIWMLAPDDERLQEIQRIREEVAQGRAVKGMETLRRRKDGSMVEVGLTVSPVFDARGRVASASVIARDITARRQLERDLMEERARLQEAQRVARLGIWEHRPADGTTRWSDELYRILGAARTVEPTPSKYLSFVHPADRLQVAAQWNRVLSGDGDMATTHRVVRPDGGVRWVEARSWLVNGSGVVRGTVQDITELKQAEAALSHQALHDPLTGLPNRLLVTDRLEQLLARAERRRSRTAVALVDLDRFKVINDGIGHAVGDTVLVAVAERLRSAGGPNDTIGRFGGDEFVALREDVVGTWEAERFGEALLRVLDEPFTVAGREVYLGASVGVVVSRPGTTADEMFRDADIALNRAKDRGRNRVELHDEGVTEKAVARIELETALRGALQRGELWVAYQPIVDVATESPVGVEALVRWQRSDGTLVSPAEFVPVAEETGLIASIGQFVLRQALADLAALRAAHPALADLYVAVNVSGHQLVKPDLVAIVTEELEAAGLEPSALHLEITESVLMEDVERSVALLSQLRDTGVGLSVDDFGTGYCSLSYLKRLPLDVLKVDRSFVDGLGIDPNDSSIVDAITALGRALGLDVLAEGVEDDRQRLRLTELGCRFGQGFLWSRPQGLDAAAEWLARAAGRARAGTTGLE